MEMINLPKAESGTVDYAAQQATKPDTHTFFVVVVAEVLHFWRSV